MDTCLFGTSAYCRSYNAFSTRAFCTYAYGHGHLFLVQVLKVVHTHAFVHMLMDMNTCFLCKCLRLSVHVRLYTCLGNLRLLFAQVLNIVRTRVFVHTLMDFTLVVCSSV